MSSPEHAKSPVLTGSAALVALTGFLLVFGSTVRVHGAGLSCPDWPLCFGQVVPEYEFRTFLEFGHRVVAGTVSLGFLALAVVLWRTGRFARSPSLRRLVPLAAAVLALQVVLGGLTVLELLAEWTVASHLVTGNTFAALLLATALAIRAIDRPVERAGVTVAQRALTVVLAVLVPSQLVLGGLVAGSHAGLACGTWPSCNGGPAFPTFEGLIGLQVMHRLTAYGIALAAIVNVAVQWRNVRTRRAALVLLGVVAAQVALGVANVLLYLPVEVTLAHSAGAASIALTTTWLLDEAWRAPLALAEGVAPARGGDRAALRASEAR